jgi:hypothetical protein
VLKHTFLFNFHGAVPPKGGHELKVLAGRPIGA